MHDHIKILCLVSESPYLWLLDSLIVCVLILKRQQHETFQVEISWLFQANLYVLHRSCTAILSTREIKLNGFRVNSRSKGNTIVVKKLLVKYIMHTEYTKILTAQFDNLHKVDMLP